MQDVDHASRGENGVPLGLQNSPKLSLDAACHGH